MKTIDILKQFAINETNEAGVKGLVIWEEDFQEIASRIEALGKDKTSAEEWLKNKLDEQEYTYDLRDSNRKAFPLKIWIEWMEQYAKYRTT